MKRMLMLAAIALALTGCEKVSGYVQEARRKKADEASSAQEAAARAAAKLALRRSESYSVKNETADSRRTAEALVELLCSSPEMMEDIEGELDTMSALSGPGVDPVEARRFAADFRERYSPAVSEGLAARGGDFSGLKGLAEEMGQDVARKKFRALVRQKCPGSAPLAEKAALGLLRHCGDPK